MKLAEYLVIVGDKRFVVCATFGEKQTVKTASAEIQRFIGKSLGVLVKWITSMGGTFRYTGVVEPEEWEANY